MQVLPRRSSESAAHLELKRLALFWAQKMGYHSCAFEIALPNCRYRADLAAYQPIARRVWVKDDGPLKTGRLQSQQSLGTTAIFECKQARADFLKDSRPALATAEKLRELHARRTVLERQLKIHYPSLRTGDSLFSDYDSHDFSGLDHAGYAKVLADITKLQSRLFNNTKFDTLVRYGCGNLFYVVAEDSLLEPHEVPVCWGLLVRRNSTLELRQKPVWQDAGEACRLALLHKIAVAGTRALNRAQGIAFEDIFEARRLGG
ncbi:MAG: hypothetical protein JO295_10495 [Verrucomicrobia bacterium]|nr:hypothetical protein [Verrucomicrobiota bacterium]